jgi:sn-glycerol 3-phosphate transport system substrate-binding protein
VASAFRTPATSDRVHRRALLQAGAALGALACDSLPEQARGRRSFSLWFTYGGKNREVLETLVARYNAAQTDDFVRPVFQGDYFEGLAKLRVAVAARCAPALSHVVGEVVPYLAEAGVLEPLDRYPGARAFDIVPELGQAGSWVGGGARPLVALPFNRSTPIAYLNGALFERARLRAPESWAELRETARALTDSTGQSPRFGFGCPINWWFWVALVGQAGGQVVEADGRVSLGDDAGRRALELWQTLVVRDRSMKPPPGRDYNAWEQTNQDFLAGRVAMIWTSTAFLKYLEENARFPVIAAPLPEGRRRSVPTGGTHWVILEQAEEAEKAAAFRFLTFMHQTPQAVDWATRTGYIPVTTGAIHELEARGFYAKHPNDRVTIDQLAVATPWPWSTSLFRLQREIVQPRLEQAVLAGGDARTLLDEARALASSARG